MRWLTAGCLACTLILSACSSWTLQPGGASPPQGTSQAGAGYSDSPPIAVPPPPPLQPHWGSHTKTSGCAARGPLPDPDCTPGDVDAQATRAQICTPGYARSVRNVPVSLKDQVYQSYGIAHHNPGEYEVDHLVSLELGGTNDISNLWPELASPNPGFHEKDAVENYLHDQMCAGSMPLADVQREIAQNWLAVYQQIQGGQQVQPALPQANPTFAPVAPADATQPAQATRQPYATRQPRPTQQNAVTAGPITGPGTAQPVNGTCPADYPIKGNIRRDGRRIYHVPSEQAYAHTVPEACFADVAAATAAGFVAPR